MSKKTHQQNQPHQNPNKQQPNQFASKRPGSDSQDAARHKEEQHKAGHQAGKNAQTPNSANQGMYGKSKPNAPQQPASGNNQKPKFGK